MTGSVGAGEKGRVGEEECGDVRAERCANRSAVCLTDADYRDVDDGT